MQQGLIEELAMKAKVVQDADVVTYMVVCGTTRGGHLLEGWVFPTLEVIVTEAPAELRKVMRPEIGIALIDLDRSQS
jgi:hypothetical protein